MECNFENCGYYTDGECNICGMGISGEDTFCRLCKDNPNCYYKQNAELKEEVRQLHKGRSPEELYTLFGKPIKYWEQLEQENEKLASWLESSEREKKELCNVIHKRKEQIQTLKYMLFDEKEIPKDKFTMYYRIAQNERRTKSHRDLCTNIVKKYKTSLQEIKEIAEFHITDADSEDVQNDMKQIIDLITKAEEDR